MNSMPVSRARDEMKDLVNRVAYSKERIVLTSHDKKMAVIISMEDLEALEAYEDAEDIRLADESFKDIQENGTYTMEEMKKIWGI